MHVHVYNALHCYAYVHVHVHVHVCMYVHGLVDGVLYQENAPHIIIRDKQKLQASIMTKRSAYREAKQSTNNKIHVLHVHVAVPRARQFLTMRGDTERR